MSSLIVSFVVLAGMTICVEVVFWKLFRRKLSAFSLRENVDPSFKIPLKHLRLVPILHTSVLLLSLFLLLLLTW